MQNNPFPIYKYRKAQIGIQVVRKILEKKRSLHQVNEHFSQEFYGRDVPNMGFY